MDMIQYKVTGTVQGVNFRHYTQKEANKLGLKGWCHNHPDESVEGVAVGPADKLKQFQQYLQKGPSAAEVSNVELLRQQHDLSEDEVKKELGSLKGYETRHYQG